MDLNEYQTLALRTATAQTPHHDITHAGFGFASEAGEYVDVLKKEHAYGKPIDTVNLAEEIGDILWFCALACRGLGITLEGVGQTNVLKLRARYPLKFTNEEALTRDLIAERSVLEFANLVEVRNQGPV